MLIATNLISEIQCLLFVVNHWNAMPFQYPFRLKYKSASQNYKFLLNPMFLQHHWLYFCFVLTFAFILGTFRAFTESKSVSDRVSTLFIAYFAVLYAISLCFHKIEVQQFCKFMNQLLSFENFRSTVLTKDERFNWRNQQATMTVKWIIRTFTFALLTHSILYSLSCTLNPNVPWNIVPVKLINNLSYNLGSKGLVKYFLFVYLYITIRIYTNLSSTNILINLLLPTFSFSKSLKFVSKRLQVSQSIEAVLDLLSLYQQINLLCIFYNNIHRKCLLPLLIVSGIVCLSIPVFVITTRLDYIDFTAVVVFINLIGISFGLIFGCLKYAANLNKQSLSLIRGFKCKLLNSELHSDPSKLIIFRKKIRSMYPLKIMYLNSNYLTRITPLVFLKISGRLAVQLVLLDR